MQILTPLTTLSLNNLAHGEEKTSLKEKKYVLYTGALSLDATKKENVAFIKELQKVAKKEFKKEFDRNFYGAEDTMGLTDGNAFLGELKKTIKELEENDQEELASEKREEYLAKARWYQDRFTIYVKSYSMPRFYKATIKDGKATVVAKKDSVIKPSEREEYIYSGAKILTMIKPVASHNTVKNTKSVYFELQYGVFVTHGSELQPMEVEEEKEMQIKSINSALEGIVLDEDVEMDLAEIELPEE